MIKAIDEHDEPRATASADFAAFVLVVEPRLRRALAGSVGVDDAADAVAEALTYAWQHWDRVQGLENPAGYLYRVARSSARVRPPRRVRYVVPEVARVPLVEPALPDALRALPEKQRIVVWLVYACEWSYAEVAEALAISASAVGTHARRALRALRSEIGVSNG